MVAVVGRACHPACAAALPADYWAEVAGEVLHAGVALSHTMRMMLITASRVRLDSASAMAAQLLLECLLRVAGSEACLSATNESINLRALHHK